MAGDTLLALQKEYPPGTILFEENDPGSRMYVIRSGKVRIFKRGTGTEMVLAFLGAGDFFGEMALLEGLPRSATAMVVESAKLIEVEASTFEEMIRGNAEIAIRIMRKLAARLRESDRRFEYMLIDSAIGRALEVLRWLLPQGVVEDSWSRLVGVRDHIDITKQAGVPLLQAGSVMQELVNAKCVRVEGDDLLIAQSNHLDAYATYLEMRHKYEQQAYMPFEAVSKNQEERSRAMQVLLLALKVSPEDLDARQQELANNYRKYFELKQRFNNLS